MDIMNVLNQIQCPFEINIDIINKCNYNCLFCQSGISHNRDPLQKLMNSEEIIHLIKEFADLGGMNIFLTGGEPILRKDLPLFIRKGNMYNLGMSTSSNGINLTNSLIKELYESGLRRIQISVHGPQEIHEKITKSKKGTYNIVKKRIVKLVNYNIKVEIASVGLNENITSLPILLEDLAPLGINTFRVLRFMPLYHLELIRNRPKKQLIHKIFPKLHKIARKNNIDIFFNACPGVITKKIKDQYHHISPFIHFCKAGKTQMDILPDGSVFPCASFRYHPEFLIGNVTKQSITELWNNPIIKKFKKITPDDYIGACGRCNEKWSCYSCRAIALDYTNSLYGDDISCYYITKD